MLCCSGRPSFFYQFLTDDFSDIFYGQFCFQVGSIGENFQLDELQVETFVFVFCSIEIFTFFHLQIESLSFLVYFYRF
uniref:Ovule protein n=1 Tax=Panagrolaimus sp. JU765 TaxID=591449 RepID=A0AC34R8A6_9BILA